MSFPWVRSGRRRAGFCAILMGMVWLLGVGRAGTQSRPALPFRADRIYCARLVYAGNRTAQLFSDQFLTRLRDVSALPVEPQSVRVRLDSPELFRYPFAVLSGEGSFRFSESERVQLKRYLRRGGFVLASAGCSDRAWARAFRAEFARLFPDARLQRLTLSHPLFRMVYRIDTLATVHRAAGVRQGVIEGFELDGRLAVLFSPDGLNDTVHTDGCCCSGDEIARAEFINANALAYAVLR